MFENNFAIRQELKKNFMRRKTIKLLQKNVMLYVKQNIKVHANWIFTT